MFFVSTFSKSSQFNTSFYSPQPVKPLVPSILPPFSLLSPPQFIQPPPTIYPPPQIYLTPPVYFPIAPVYTPQFTPLPPVYPAPLIGEGGRGGVKSLRGRGDEVETWHLVKDMA